MITLPLGQMSQYASISGWIPQEIILTANKNIKTWETRFNVRTYNIDGRLTLIPCICEGEIAKGIAESYRKNDFIQLFGQLQHTYYPELPNYAKVNLRVKILSYTILATLNAVVTEPDIEESKKIFLESVIARANLAYEKNRDQPTDEEIQVWVEHFKDYDRKKREEKKNAKKYTR